VCRFPAQRIHPSNSFVAKYDANLSLIYITFLGAGRTVAAGVAATADAVFVTGITFNAAFPVTAAGLQQTPATGSSENGFVERFNAAGTSLVYATYLTGANGNTMPVAIVADSADDAIIAGATTASGYPTVAAMQPEILGATSGFLTKLTPGGDGITFSTYLAGSGITSMALDAASSSLLLSGNLSLGQFPIATVAMPLTSMSYQSLLRLSLDGQTLMPVRAAGAGLTELCERSAGWRGMGLWSPEHATLPRRRRAGLLRRRQLSVACHSERQHRPDAALRRYPGEQRRLCLAEQQSSQRRWCVVVEQL
jgi:hypothetical protein